MAEDFPILLWRENIGWKVVDSPRMAEADFDDLDQPLIWFSLPKE